MTWDNDPAILAAQRFYGTHNAEHLTRDCDRLVDRCTQHLLGVFPLARNTAQILATQALAELESTKVQGFIDIDRSNGRMVMLRDTEANTWHLVTLPELFQLVRTRQQTPTETPAAG